MLIPTARSAKNPPLLSMSKERMAGTVQSGWSFTERRVGRSAMSRRTEEPAVALQPRVGEETVANAAPTAASG